MEQTHNGKIVSMKSMNNIADSYQQKKSTIRYQRYQEGLTRRHLTK